MLRVCPILNYEHEITVLAPKAYLILCNGAEALINLLYLRLFSKVIWVLPQIESWLMIGLKSLPFHNVAPLINQQIVPQIHPTHQLIHIILLLENATSKGSNSKPQPQPFAVGLFKKASGLCSHIQNVSWDGGEPGGEFKLVISIESWILAACTIELVQCKSLNALIGRRMSCLPYVLDDCGDQVSRSWWQTWSVWCGSLLSLEQQRKQASFPTEMRYCDLLPDNGFTMSCGRF